ncbi:MAG TPA: S-methyl-5'-thioadenosine phosphorylase [Anaerolineaceae bacterium]|nr:S-methyl-5'-thioadenosine phosphorylase [Anaerolineaceae bacterium]
MSDQNNPVVGPVLAIIGGTGLYQFPALKDIESIEVDTPFGKPSSPIIIGRLHGVKVAFLARHGIGHFIMPHEVNYRANIYALKQLGVHRVIGVNACGSLREDYAPGEIVIPDQLVDFTRKRANTFFGEGLVAHVGTADPFCPDLSAQMYKAVVEAGGYVHQSGTLITVEGPRFSTKGESNMFRAWGMDIIGMTTSPEAFLAREAEMCYACMAHVTDYDVWHITEETVSVEMVIRTLHNNAQLAQKSISLLLKNLLPDTTCQCGKALENTIMTAPERIPPETRQKLGLLVDKYLSK